MVLHLRGAPVIPGGLLDLGRLGIPSGLMNLGRLGIRGGLQSRDRYRNRWEGD